MAVHPTWKPYTVHDGTLSEKEREKLPDSTFAYPTGRKEPLTDASHVINALARFDQVKGVSDADRDLAWANILAAAKHYGVQVDEKDWRELGKKPHTTNPAHESHHHESHHSTAEHHHSHGH
jgi:hypothetical protein